MGKYEFNLDQVKRDLARPKMATGTHAFLIQSATTSEKTDGQFAGTKQVMVEQQSLSDPEDSSTTRGQSVRRYFDLPVDNPDVDGHAYPPWANREWITFLSALGLIEAPRFNNVEKQWYVGSDTIDKKERGNAELEAAKAAWEFAVERLESNDFSDLCNRVYITDVSYKTAEDGTVSEYPKFAKTRPELGEGESLVEGSGMEGSAEAPAPAKAPAKTAAKAPAKKGRK